jgi:RNA-directed DNA polymerase
MLQKRLSDFKLSLNKSKTQLIEFGRFAKINRQARKESKPKTFYFLGFTHIYLVRWGSDQFTLLRTSIKKKLRAKIREIKEALRRRINRPPYETGQWLNKVLTGYFNYFAVPRNGQSLGVMRTEVCKLWLKILRRRSQKGRKLNWHKMNRWVRFFIPLTRIRHPHPNQRFHL